jgi:GNAT superfamily N-acetyltransferase
MPTNGPQIRRAKSGDEPAIHEAHMRSIREICVKDHGEKEISGWGHRPLGDRWTEAINQWCVWVVEWEGSIYGHACLRLSGPDEAIRARILGLYLTPEVLHQGFGFSLANLMLEEARRAGAKSVTLDSSITAHDFYRRLGFVDAGPVKHEEIGGSFVTAFPMVFSLQ